MIEELRVVDKDNALNMRDEIARVQDKSKAVTENNVGKQANVAGRPAHGPSQAAVYP
ncbi:hypothetical protein ACV35P_32750 [Pseudomonas aeruginosa]